MPSPPYTSPYAPDHLNEAFRIADLIRQQGYTAAEQPRRRGKGAVVADLVTGAGMMGLEALDRRDEQRRLVAENNAIADAMASGEDIDLPTLVRKLGLTRAKEIVPLVEASIARRQALADKQLAASDKANEKGMWQMSADALRQPGADRYAIQDQYFGQTGKTLPMSDLAPDPKVAEAERQKQMDDAMILRSGDALKRPGADPRAINQELWQETGGRKTIPKELLPPEAEKQANSLEDVFLLGNTAVKGDYIPGTGGKPGSYWYNGENVTGRARPLPTASAGGGGDAGDENIQWTEGAIDQAAAAYAMTFQLPPLGQGKNAAATKTLIANRAAVLFPEADLAGNRAAYIANRSNLTQLVKMRGAIGAFEATAQKNIDLFLEKARQVTDTSIPILNAPVRWVTGNILGSQEQAAYAAARLVALAEMSRVTSNPNLTGVVAEKSRDEMREILAGRATLAQTIASIETLKKDMANRIVSIEDEIKTATTATRATLTGGAPSTAFGGAGATTPPPVTTPPLAMAPIAPVSSSPRNVVISPPTTPRPPVVAIPAPQQAAPVARRPQPPRIPGKIYVVDPNGDDHPFDTQEQADNFKRAIGVR